MQISRLAGVVTPDLDRKMKDNIARKSGHKHVSGDTYKRRSRWQQATDFIQCTRAASVVGKAHFESKQYLQAALIRKDHQATKAIKAGDASDADYDDLVWNSNGVQNRLTREDFVRYNGHNYYERSESSRNKWAARFSKMAHHLQGVCEIAAAPTGMSYNGVRNLAYGSIDEKGAKNKVIMFGLLGFIGVATTELLGALRGATEGGPKMLGKSIMGVLIAFPAVSAGMGFLGTVAGAVSQLLIEKEKVSTTNQEKIKEDLDRNFTKLYSQLKTIKGNEELTRIMGKAMQGRNHWIDKKIQSNATDDSKIPIILNKVLDAIDPLRSDVDNMNRMKDAIGDYLQVTKPTGAAATKWALYRYAKAVTTKESHYVALMSTVDHMEVEYPHAKDFKDLRRYTEETIAENIHDWVLNKLAVPAALFDSVANTKISPTLKKWGSEAYRKRQAAKLNDPTRAQANRYNGAYMVKNSSQYPPITRSLLRIAESMRIINLNVILASNANLSRIFNNAALAINKTVGTGPASRIMCHSIGRFFGGTLLAIIFGTVIPLAVDGTDSSMEEGSKSDTQVSHDKSPVDFQLTNIGILMFLFSIPTLCVLGLAQLTARMEDWNGNELKQPPSNAYSYQFPR